MFALYAAIGAVGVVGALGMNVMKGPVRGMQQVTQKTIAENNMIASAKLAVMAASNQPSSGDCDGDNTVEPIAWNTSGTGPKPTGGGYLPADIGASLQDPWGNTYGYCAWDHGAAIQSGCPTPTQRLRGVGTGGNGPVIAIISSGPDRAFQTSCGHAPTYVNKVAGSDDIVLSYTYAEAQAASSGLWYLQSTDLNTAEIKKDLEVRNTANQVVFGVDSTTDINRPAIKVDYIQQLSRGAVEYLSNIALGDNWLSGDGGDEGIYIDNQGSVGIGTSDPLSPLHVNGTGQFGRLNVNAEGSGFTGLHLYQSAWSSGNNMPMILWESGNPSVTRVHYIRQSGNVLNFHSSDGVGGGTPWPGTITAMSIAGDGKIGIGTGAPSEVLHVNGKTRIDQGGSYDLWLQGGAAASGTDRNLALLGRKSDDRLIINHSSEYTGGTQIGGPVIVSGGTLNMSSNKIVGLATPTAAADATTKSYVDSRTGGNESDPKIGTINNGKWCYGASGKVVCDRETPLSTSTGDGRYLRLTGGTLTGNLWFSGGTRYIGTSSNNNFVIRTNATNRITIAAGGTTTFAGDVRGPAFLYSSDARLKAGIEPFSSSLEDLARINAYRYHYRADEAQTPHIGVLAQEVKDILPEVVKTGDDGMMAVDYPALVPVLIDAVKRLDDRTKALEAANDNLRHEIRALTEGAQ